MISGKTLLETPKKLSYISDSKKDTINGCDLQQLLYWYDETVLHYTKGGFLLASNKEIIIYPNMGYNFYTGRAYTPLQILTDELKIPYKESLYLLNYFYHKIKKAPLNAALTGWTAKSYAERCATGKNDSLDLDYIKKENLFASPDSTIKAAAMKRAIAYGEGIITKERFLSVSNRTMLSCFRTAGLLKEKQDAGKGVFLITDKFKLAYRLF